MKDNRIKTQNASSIHRWHSSEYVKEWSHKAQQDLVARQGHEFLVSLLPFPSEAEIRLLELMAGYGRLSRYILSAFPQAQMTLVDFSRLMQRRAKEHLSQFLERLQFILADVDDPSWKNKVEGDYDIVVSSKAIHDLQLSSQRRISHILTSCGIIIPHINEDHGVIQTQANGLLGSFPCCLISYSRTN